jgi:hypothetical protein
MGIAAGAACGDALGKAAGRAGRIGAQPTAIAGGGAVPLSSVATGPFGLSVRIGDESVRLGSPI